jgi:hypothetical protein
MFFIDRIFLLNQLLKFIVLIDKNESTDKKMKFPLTIKFSIISVYLAISFVFKLNLLLVLFKLLYESFIWTYLWSF